MWGERRGKEATAGFFAAIAEAIEVTELTPLSFAANDNEVMVFLRFGFRGPASGKEANMRRLPACGERVSCAPGWRRARARRTSSG